MSGGGGEEEGMGWGEVGGGRGGGKEGRREGGGVFHESWRRSMGGVSLCYSIERTTAHDSSWYTK